MFFFLFKTYCHAEAGRNVEVEVGPEDGPEVGAEAVGRIAAGAVEGLRTNGPD